MEWFAVVTGTLGVIFGGYGAWRSWRTDRAQKLLGKKWDIETRPRNVFLFVNRQPRTVYAPRVTGPAGHIVSVDGSTTVLLPNEALEVVVLIMYEHDSGPMEVTWHHRPDLGDKPRRWRGHLPPAPDERSARPSSG